jgi:AmmeMemoRadiSam system protein B
LTAARDSSDPRYFYLWDQLRLSDKPQRVSMLELEWIQLFDGQRTLREIQVEAIQRLGGQLLPLELFVSLTQRLDQALFLDGPRYRERVDSPIREPSCIGTYESDPERLRRQLHRLFTCPGGPGLPNPAPREGAATLRAALIPHIDFNRGGITFAWGFKEVFERADVSLFVIIGTAHYSPCRFTLTRKNFKTPLGIVPTDQAYIDKLVSYYGDGLFDDELAHLPEHSIELEVVFLQYLYEGRRPIRIVPLLVGSFQDCVVAGSKPSERDDIGRMIESLQKVENELPEPICYIISGDLAHLGPKFGDAAPVEDGELSHSRGLDQALLRQAEAVDTSRYFQIIADEGDRRRICGLPPTYTALEAARPQHGKLLHYDQYAHPDGLESVSFASVAFYR